jgi:hypothetical protein
VRPPLAFDVGYCLTQPRRVFAERISSTRAKWNLLAGRFAWTRFATKTMPKVPWEEKDIVIPWPTPDRPTLPDRK